MHTLEPLMERNFLEYASYVIVDRAIPDVRDGLKPVQRRILATLWKMDDGKFHKVANVIGETMKLHPHGDASIGDALVVLANKELFIEKQGNFGNIATGHSAAAPRYIECRLTDLARETLFGKAALTTFQPSYDGRNKEPVCLPSKLPVAMLIGAEGIAVGMATKILPHNFVELLEAQMKILEYDAATLYPDFPTGGLMDVAEYADGKGKVKVRARIERPDDKTIVIREVPFGTTTESLIASIEAATQKGKVKVAGINDFTTDHVEIEITLPRGVYADEVIPQLYAYTDCEVSVSSNIVLIRDRHPVEMTVSEALRFLTDQLRETIGKELEFELLELKDKQHWLSLERIFIEERVYKRIEKATTEDQVKREVYAGLKPHLSQLERPVTDDDVKRLLDIPIRRISLFDIEKNKRDFEDVDIAISKLNVKLGKLTKTTIDYLKGLIKKYGAQFPRRTEIAAFEAVDRRDVARQNIKVTYDPETGFFGSDVKGTEYQFTVSEYDRILIVTRDGKFRIIGPDAKVLIPGKIAFMDVFDQKRGQVFTILYRDKAKNAFGKKIHIQRFIRDREYELFPTEEGKLDYLIPGEAGGTLRIEFIPHKRQRVAEGLFALSELEMMGLGARGKRLAPKPAMKVKWIRTGDTTVEGDTIIPPPPGSAKPSVVPPSRPTVPAKKPTLADEDDDGQFKLF